MVKPFYLFLIVFLFIINITFSFAHDELILNIPNEVSNLQNFPLEIYVPKELRNITKEVVFSTNCQSLRIKNLENFRSGSNYQYSGEIFLSFNASIKYTSKDSDPLPGDCNIRVLFMTSDSKFSEISKDIRIQPVKVFYDIKEHNWEYFKANKDDFRGSFSYSFFDRGPDCSFISANTIGVKTYYVEFSYNAEDFNEVISVQNKSLKEYMEFKTNQYVGAFLQKKAEYKGDFKINEITIPGFKEAYELDLSAATKSFETYHGCYDQHYRIYGLTNEGDSIVIFSRFYGRLNSLQEVKDMFENNKKDMSDILRSFRIDGMKYNFKSLMDDRVFVYEEEEEEGNMSSKSFEISFSGKNTKTIWNRGRFNTGDDDTDDSFLALVRIKGEAYDENGKKLKKISSDELFSGVRLVAKIDGVESQIGFGSSLSLDFIQTVSSSLHTLDIRGKGPRLYKSFYRPKETFKVYLEYEGRRVSNEIVYTVNVKDASPRIKLQNDMIEVQDGNKRMISFKVEDDDKSKLKCIIMVPTSFAIKGGIPLAYVTYKGEDTTLVNIDCKGGDNIKLMFNAPKFGNFDLNNELDALSMWKMQEDTMKSLVTDLVGFGVELRTNQLKQKSQILNRFSDIDNYIQAVPNADLLQNIKNVDRALNTLETASDLSTNAQNLIKLPQIGSNIKDLQTTGDQAVGTGNQGWLEWGADWGVFGIDIAQSTVGAIAMAPGKLPVVGPLGKKIGAGFSLTFNLMTNVWRGNFQYLSKVEKINRAKDMKFPYPVIITIEDEDGFVTKEIQNVMVVYNWLD